MIWSVTGNEFRHKLNSILKLRLLRQRLEFGYYSIWIMHCYYGVMKNEKCYISIIMMNLWDYFYFMSNVDGEE